MKKAIYFSATALLVAIFCITFTDNVSADDVQVGVEIVGYDSCPNIPGYQPSVPDGMAIDTNGNCYTPTPPPVIVDVCNNLPGVQSLVPSGYYRTNDGNCYRRPLPPEPPVDVCPNLPEAQEEIPENYYLDPETNTCLPVELPEPPDTAEDVCLNIPGVQVTTPSGMRNDDGRCYTPAPTPPPTKEPLKNVPDFLQPFGEFLVGIVPEPIRQYFRDLPEDIVGQLPFFAFILVLILILIPIPQTIREYYYKRRLIAFYKREQNISEEKDNFINIASHYLRTPIAIMRDSIPLMLSSNDITQYSSENMTSALGKLSDQISTNLSSAEANPALGNAYDPSSLKTTPFYRSGFFWLPIILSAILTFIANFLIGVVGDKVIGFNNAIFQIVIIIIFIVLVYLIVRNYQIQKHLREEEDLLISRERAIDAIRNDFLEQQTVNISTALGTLELNSQSTNLSKEASIFVDGRSRLRDIFNKFVLLTYIKTGANRSTSNINLRTIVDNAITNEQGDIAKKQLTVENSVGTIPMVQNEQLLSFVVNSVFNNAVKFSETGGHISVTNQPQNKTVTVKISDSGRGIDPAKLDQLFKPFSSAESSENLAPEGLGLSLFLNRLIINYIGGNITAAPRAGGGTDVTFTIPVDISNLIVDQKSAPKTK